MCVKFSTKKLSLLIKESGADYGIKSLLCNHMSLKGSTMSTSGFF